MKGIAAAELDTSGRRLRLTYDPALLSLPMLERRVRDAGVALARRFRHATLRLEGLHCSDCAGAVEHGATHAPGILSATASFAAASLHVEYDPDLTDLDGIAGAVGRLGYRALLPGMASEAVVVRVAEMDCQDEVKAIELSTAASGFLLAGALGMDWLNGPPLATLLLYVLTMLTGGWMTPRKAVRAVLARRLDMNALRRAPSRTARQR